MGYYPEPESHSTNKMKVELDLSCYATKSDIEKAMGVDTSEFTKKIDLGCLKSKVDKIDAGKLKSVPIDLSKLNNEVDRHIVKKALYDKLVAKVNTFDTTVPKT